MSELNITSAQYTLDREGNNSAINITVDGITMSVPMTAGNSDYDEIMRQVEAGTLTIKETI